MRNVVKVSRPPVIPHLHLVNLKKEEKIIDKALFDKESSDAAKKDEDEEIVKLQWF